MNKKADASVPRAGGAIREVREGTRLKTSVDHSRSSWSR
jgi:hypothetical protein